MNDLNTAQRAAVRYLDGPLLVLAGAGSGKTRVITHKIAYLIRECALAPRHIAAVTFTNKAAREMKQRVSGLLKGKEARGLRISTFHTLGLTIIRQEHRMLGLKPGFTIFDARDSLQLIQELAHQHDDAAAAQQIQWLISRWKSSLVDPQQALQTATDNQEVATARLYADYNRQLRAYNAVDFDDLLQLPLQLFQTHPDVLDTWQNRLRYLLVDEYQDTNTCQYHLVKVLIGERGALTVVGDDDQSIYAWRGAQPENLRLLQEDFPSLKVIKLEQNYRSARSILIAANHLIAHNPRIFEGKKLWSELGPGEPLRIIVCKSGDDEAERVVAELIHHRFKHATRYGDYAILYRGNHQSRPFEQCLRNHRVAYRLSGGTSFFEHTEVKDILAYLRLLINPDDDAAFLRIVNVPRREIGPTTLEKLSAYAAQREISLLAACFELGLAQHLNERALQRLQRFAHWIRTLAERAEHDDSTALIRDMVNDIQYEQWLRSSSKDPRSAERRMENVDELLDWLKRMEAESDTDSGTGKSLAERVAKLTLMDILERNEDSDTATDAVTLMTLHTAKGLEFPFVFIVGVEEDLLPHRNSTLQGDLEEERRLMYVGITRAQRTLTLTLAQRRKRFGEWQQCEPSRFLDELPQQELIWQGRDRPLPAEQRQERGREHLAVLKGMLSSNR
jgi:ATP-dependent DNA helicase Rep